MEQRKQTRKDARAPVGPGEARELGALLFQLLCADDLRQPSVRWPLSRVAEVELGRAESPADRIDGALLRLGLADPFASARHARLTCADGAWQLQDEGSTNGTRVNGERLPPLRPVLLRGGDLIEAGHTFFLFRDSASGRSGAAAGRSEAGATTLSPEWELVLDRAGRLAATAHSILIQGESGSGKEVLARLLHQRSGRTGPLVSVNCGALAEHLLEDELFGHVRGAFSGAHTDRQGLLRAAHQGTLLLDEIGDMPASLQVKLLRVLEDQKVRPVGSEREVEVDLRVIAATHRDLRALVREGKFRNDLLARLGLLPIWIPPLRERREDLGLLVRALLQPALPLERIRFGPDALGALLRHSWPLNVRELQRVLLAALDLALHEGGEVVTIEPRHLPELVPAVAEVASLGPAPPQPAPRRRRPAPRHQLTEEEKRLRDRVEALLRQHHGNVAAVARDLGRARSQVQRWMARFEIDLDALLGP